MACLMMMVYGYCSSNILMICANVRDFWKVAFMLFCGSILNKKKI